MQLNIEINLDSACFERDLNGEMTYILTLLADRVRDKAEEIVMPLYDSTGMERVGQWSITQRSLKHKDKRL